MQVPSVTESPSWWPAGVAWKTEAFKKAMKQAHLPLLCLSPHYNRYLLSSSATACSTPFPLSDSTLVGL